MVRLAEDDDASHLVNFRGVEPVAFLVHEQVRIVEGRAPGVGEVLVGKLAAVRMGVSDEHLAVGRKLVLDENEWTVSGRFEAPGTVMEAEVWCRLSDLIVATRHENLSCVVITFDEGEDLSEADVFAQQRLELEVVALRETDYYGKVNAFYAPVRAMVWVTAVLVGAGAFFGGLNTLYAAFSARVAELGTLQAIGFSRGALLASLVQEAVLTSAAGSLVAALVALLALDGVAVRISMGAFGLRVDGPVMAAGLATGLLLGVVGTIPPAWRCLGMPLSSALKS
jgi:putative ABC transport system permease protein